MLLHELSQFVKEHQNMLSQVAINKTAIFFPFSFIVIVQCTRMTNNVNIFASVLVNLGVLYAIYEV